MAVVDCGNKQKIILSALFSQNMPTGNETLITASLSKIWGKMEKLYKQRVLTSVHFGGVLLADGSNLVFKRWESAGEHSAARIILKNAGLW